MANTQKIANDTSDTKTSTIKYVTWQVPFDYTEEEMEKIQDDKILHAIGQIDSGELYSNEEMLARIQNLKLKKFSHANNLD
jgi:predicted transcriptional regulator